MDFSRNTCLSLSFITLSFSFLFSIRLIALPKVNNYKLNSEFIDSVVQDIKNNNKQLFEKTLQLEESFSKTGKSELIKIQTNIKTRKQKKVVISQPKALKDKPRTKIKVKAIKSLKTISQEPNTIFLTPKPIQEPLQVKFEEEFPVLRKPSQI
jgi:hypothetical protein